MVIGISGKIGSGKDTIGYAILHHIARSKGHNTSVYPDKEPYETLKNKSDWEIKKFADKLKDIICLLIGCTREDLEDRDFKERELGEEWNYFTLNNEDNIYSTHLTRKEAELKYEHRLFVKPEDTKENFEIVERFYTPRKLLQLLGTEAGRDIIHPNIWVNALFSTYKPISYNSIPNNDSLYGESYTEIVYPNWVITDMRFPNELKAVKDRGGITIRVNRLRGPLTGNRLLHISEKENIGQHSSETALDNAEFDYVIDNNGTIEELIRKVKEILIKEKII